MNVGWNGSNWSTEPNSAGIHRRFSGGVVSSKTSGCFRWVISSVTCKVTPRAPTERRPAYQVTCRLGSFCPTDRTRGRQSATSGVRASVSKATARAPRYLPGRLPCRQPEKNRRPLLMQSKYNGYGPGRKKIPAGGAVVLRKASRTRGGQGASGRAALPASGSARSVWTRPSRELIIWAVWILYWTSGRPVGATRR